MLNDPVEVAALTILLVGAFLIGVYLLAVYLQQYEEVIVGGQ